MPATMCTTIGMGQDVKRESVGRSSVPPSISVRRAAPATTGIAASATRLAGTHRAAPGARGHHAPDVVTRGLRTVVAAVPMSVCAVCAVRAVRQSE